jgi:hypothetical protein
LALLIVLPATALAEAPRLHGRIAPSLLTWAAGQSVAKTEVLNRSEFPVVATVRPLLTGTDLAAREWKTKTTPRTLAPGEAWTIAIVLAQPKQTPTTTADVVVTLTPVESAGVDSVSLELIVPLRVDEATPEGQAAAEAAATLALLLETLPLWIAA